MFGETTILGGMSKTSKSKPRMGRPPKGDKAMLQPTTVRLPAPMLAEIDSIVASRYDAPERGAVIRELLAEALATRRAKEKR